MRRINSRNGDYQNRKQWLNRKKKTRDPEMSKISRFIENSSPIKAVTLFVFGAFFAIALVGSMTSCGYIMQPHHNRTMDVELQKGPVGTENQIEMLKDMLEHYDSLEEKSRDKEAEERAKIEGDRQKMAELESDLQSKHNISPDVIREAKEQGEKNGSASVNLGKNEYEKGKLRDVAALHLNIKRAKADAKKYESIGFKSEIEEIEKLIIALANENPERTSLSGNGTMSGAEFNALVREENLKKPREKFMAAYSRNPDLCPGGLRIYRDRIDCKGAGDKQSAGNNSSEKYEVYVWNDTGRNDLQISLCDDKGNCFDYQQVPLGRKEGIRFDFPKQPVKIVYDITTLDDQPYKNGSVGTPKDHVPGPDGGGPVSWILRMTPK